MELSSISGIGDTRKLLDWICLLLTLHDLGKIADGFQALEPELMRELQERHCNAPYHLRHDSLGYLIWLGERGLLARLAAETRWFAGDPDLYSWWDLLAPWIRAIAGHHGVPPVEEDRSFFPSRQFPRPVLDDAVSLVVQAARLFGVSNLPFETESYERLRPAFQRVSWLLAGVAVTADWLGSNTVFFPLCGLGMAPREYWERRAVPAARRALANSGLLPSEPAPFAGFHGIWPDYAAPTDLQRYAGEVALEPGPQLFVLEELTGSGKTEAALLLAHRLIAEGRAQGLYFALPTMATANAMYGRVGKIFRRLFGKDAKPSLALAHSKSHLLGLEAGALDPKREPGEPSQASPASVDCVAWLADSRKKALLAPVGVGTVDQALIGVLPLRHQSLRLAGLVGKVLVVDEVHAYDGYTGELLQDLLRFHSSFGGSAVLLSATLPVSHRRRYFRAFLQGLASRDGAPEDLGGEEQELSHQYPLASRVTAVGLAETRLETRDQARRIVEIRSLRTEAQAEALLEQYLAAGHCACWIRNTVDDAREAFERARERWGAQRVQLFHSRFTVLDRQRIEEEVLRRFGPESTAEERRGRLLIATQVIEQSLDLDFDLLVTDLAPIDAVLQRSGRARRHRRDISGNRSAEEGRGAPVLGILSPDPVGEVGETWYSDLFPRGAYVYRDHGRLWLTAHWLEQRGRFELPAQAREMVEAVYGGDVDASIPPALEGSFLESEGERLVEKSLAWENALSLDKGYCATGRQWHEDTLTPTRLGQPTSTLRLVRRTETDLESWDPEELHGWERSQVQVPARLAAEENPTLKDVHTELRRQMRDEGRYCLLVVLELRGAEWRGAVRDSQGNSNPLAYCEELGMRIVKETR